MNVLVVGGSPGVSAVLVAELARHADAVIAADSGGDACISAGVRPDSVVGDLDSLARATCERLKSQDVTFEVHPSHKDESDLELAMSAAKAAGATEVVLTGVTGGRLDHTLAAVGTLAASSALRPTVIETDVAWCVCSADGRREAQVVGQDATFSVMAMGAGAEVSIAGARWPLCHRVLTSEQSLGLSNRVASATAVVSVHAGTVAVVLAEVDGVRGVFGHERDSGGVGFSAGK